ncbi:MAG: DUF1203 domain-containing protein [Proteobacteria bacterium]|nr:MAG: DUF1203 domain-containing protein [Pseudomonadota bacterium]
MTFRISALPRASFAPLWALSDEDLARNGARRCVVTAKPGFPCRVSLMDAEVGEEVLLINFEHQPAATPFRASHAVYVRPQAEEANLAAGEVPALLRCRLLSLRAFDAAGMMVDAEVTAGADIESLINQLFADPRAAYIHAHAAKAGCYLARIDRG